MRTEISRDDMPAAPARESFTIEMAPIDHSLLADYAREHGQDLGWAVRRAARYLLDGERDQERRYQQSRKATAAKRKPKP